MMGEAVECEVTKPLLELERVTAAAGVRIAEVVVEWARAVVMLVGSVTTVLYAIPLRRR